MKEKEKIFKITLLNDYGDNVCQLRAIQIKPRLDYNFISIEGTTVENKFFNILTAKHGVIIEEE